MRIGVVIARFQVPDLHKGHRALLDYVANQNDSLIVMLGTSVLDGHERETPYSFVQRRVVVEESFYQSLNHPKMEIVPIEDQRDDHGWSDNVDQIIGSLTNSDDVVTLYGARQSFVKHYHGKYPVVIAPTFESISGTTIRKSITESVNREFMRGQAYTLHKQFPHAFLAVDMALCRMINSIDVLLIQRRDSGIWCFPGGFVDPTDMSSECACARELAEEVGLRDTTPWKYVGSALIDDWRYRWTTNKVMSQFYVSQTNPNEVPSLNPHEVREIAWVPFEQLEDVVSSTHQPLVTLLQHHLFPGRFPLTRNRSL